MTNEDILNWSIEAGAWKTDTGELIIEDMRLRDFADLIAKDERKFSVRFLMELHGSQLGRNNYYHYAAQALDELNGRELPNKFSLNIRNNQ
jgi:hypothetical protein